MRKLPICTITKTYGQRAANFQTFHALLLLPMMRARKLMKMQRSRFFERLAKAAFVCFLIVIRSSGVFATAEKSNSILSYRNAPRFQKAILITHQSERTSTKGSEAQSGHAHFANVTKPRDFFSSRLPSAGAITHSFSVHTNRAPRGPPISQ